MTSAILTGVTVAYFMDQETSKGNTFAAGTLDLEVKSPNLWDSVAFEIKNTAPGYTNQAEPLNVEMKNVGTIGGKKLSVKIDKYTDDPGITTEPETAVEPTDVGDLCKNVTLALYDGATLINSAKINDASWASPVEISGGLDASAIKNITAIYTVDSTAGNEIQGDVCTFDISATLEQ